MEISTAEAVNKLNQPDVIFVDVREDDERDFVRIEPSLHIPLSQFSERYKEIPKDKELVLYCHHGMRSMRATQFLRQAGYDQAINMQGGIDRWALEIDTSLARY